MTITSDPASSSGQDKPWPEAEGQPWAHPASQVSELEETSGLLRADNCFQDPVSGVVLIVVHSPSRVRLFTTPWTTTHQASLSLTRSLKILHMLIKGIQQSLMIHRGPQGYRPKESHPRPLRAANQGQGTFQSSEHPFTDWGLRSSKWAPES